MPRCELTIYVSGPVRRTICLTRCSGWTWPTQTFNFCTNAPKGGLPASTLPPSRLPGVLIPRRSSETFAGDNRHIVDYLMAEVLDGQPPHLRSFLLRTSVLGRLSGELCDAVLQTSGSASVLEEIERENLFLVPLDMSRHWYRYHQLFGELLRTELRRSEPDLVADLHRRAATWLEAEGLIDEALRHLIAAGDIARSADLIAADWVNEFNGGGLSTVSGCLDLLPEETVLTGSAAVRGPGLDRPERGSTR